MCRLIFFVFLFMFASPLFSNGSTIQGTWQGVLIRAGSTMEQGVLFYTRIENDDGNISGLTREEQYNSPYFSVKKINGTQKGNELKIEQKVELKNEKLSRQKWCMISATLSYNEKTGYLSGNFVSLDCRRVIGKIILYRSTFELSNTPKFNVSQGWFDPFNEDYQNGLNAPEIRKMERDNFTFEPIFFDYDKWDIRSEHYAFLNRLINVVKGHSDLRIRVTGHTDADGSHAYNDELSKKRAQQIISYFVTHGLREDRLVFEFKGERNPLDSNDTSEGKQRNRRVDFQFI